MAFAWMQGDRNDQFDPLEVRTLAELSAVVPAQFTADALFAGVFQLVDQFLSPPAFDKMIKRSTAADRDAPPESLGKIIFCFLVKMGAGQFELARKAQEFPGRCVLTTASQA